MAGVPTDVAAMFELIGGFLAIYVSASPYELRHVYGLIVRKLCNRVLGAYTY